MEEKSPEQFEPVEPLQLATGTCVHESAHSMLSSNAAEGVRSVLVVSSRMAMHVVEDGRLEVRFARHALLHPRLAVQVRR
ncbi:hypothetical protein [uncultured Variovorax sp.]|uniref:hypothetical protein n=1 Tax=uncultured Variovorax sp. TaxID=114708 RepID=UPI0025EE0CE0|nr:hypothetical protein [uncultured Variovorax sp.]